MKSKLPILSNRVNDQTQPGKNLIGARILGLAPDAPAPVSS